MKAEPRSTFYRALLRLYPKSFRAEYGAEMIKDFNRDWREAGAGARLGLAATAALDTIWNAWRTHADITRQDLIEFVKPDPGSPDRYPVVM